MWRICWSATTESAAGLEITLGGLQLRFKNERVVAWCGGEFDVRIGSRVLPAGHAGLVSAGEKLKIGAPKVGCRSWLSISGGIYVEPVLTSRSTDLRAGFGGYQGRALRDGDILPLGIRPGSPTRLQVSPRGPRRTTG